MTWIMTPRQKEEEKQERKKKHVQNQSPIISLNKASAHSRLLNFSSSMTDETAFPTARQAAAQ